jgi:hypothetical protein
MPEDIRRVEERIRAFLISVNQKSDITVTKYTTQSEYFIRNCSQFLTCRNIFSGFVYPKKIHYSYGNFLPDPM